MVGMAYSGNLDRKTIKGFGDEWSTFTQEGLSDSERAEVFEKYFALVDWSQKPKRALDMGCGSGRWAAVAASRVEELVVADASHEALQVARQNIKAKNVTFIESEPGN